MNNHWIFLVVTGLLFLLVFGIRPVKAESIKAAFKIGIKSCQLNSLSFAMDVAPTISNGRTIVPIRYVGYALGLKDSDMTWDQATKTAVLVKGTITEKFTVGSKTQIVNGKSSTMDVSPIIIQGRVLLPARYVAEGFGAKVNWDTANQTVAITLEDVEKADTAKADTAKTAESQKPVVSNTQVPPEYRPYFKEASEKFKIPAWFLSAVAYQESKFVVVSDNSKTGSASSCFGIMQVWEVNWKNYAPLFGFDPVTSRNDPRAQIMVGSYILSESGLKDVNWNASDWQEQTLAALKKYGGYKDPPSTYKTAEDWCREVYAKSIWDLCSVFKSSFSS